MQQVFTVNLTAVSTTEGTVIMENTTTGKKVSKDMTSSNALCLASAEWIMEDVTFDDDSTGLANFGTLTFTDAVATTNQRTLGPADADLMDIEDDDNEILTTSSVTTNTVVVVYK